ncbi:MAG: 23S rRNA (adenine(2503)-C(2))-methyltransferase RlmN [Phycisphaeraceae bacterium]
MYTRPHLFDLDADTLHQLVTDWDMPPYRSDQVLEWVYRHRVADPQRMTNLSVNHRAKITRHLQITTGRVTRHQTAADGVQKLLIEFDKVNDQKRPVVHSNASQIECVVIPTDRRKTACVSSQAGCPVGCRFCASGIGGLDANLTAGQIVEQVWMLANLPNVGRITNVVFMGMGEPLANFSQVTRAVHTLMADWGMSISGRRITISTVGLPAQVRRLADLQLPVTLAISLHAPNDSLRRRLIPWADYVTVEQLIDAGRYYFDRTGREVTLEYILLGGVNDQPEQARELATVAQRLRSNVNLIRYNEVDGLPYARPHPQHVHDFQQVLRSAGINVHLRASRGRDIAAACGQLRHEHPVTTQ